MGLPKPYMLLHVFVAGLYVVNNLCFEAAKTETFIFHGFWGLMVVMM